MLTAELCVEIDQHTNQALCSLPANDGLLDDLHDVAQLLLLFCYEMSILDADDSFTLDTIKAVDSLIYIVSLVSQLRLQLFMAINNPAHSLDVLNRMRRARCILVEVMEHIIDVI